MVADLASLTVSAAYAVLVACGSTFLRVVVGDG
jgi:hypothetical protein